MSLSLLHGFECGFHDGRVGAKIRVTHLQAGDVSSAGFERKDAVCHGDGGRLSDEIELLVEV
jgi:hypothetical protein